MIIVIHRNGDSEELADSRHDTPLARFQGHAVLGIGADPWQNQTSSWSLPRPLRLRDPHQCPLAPNPHHLRLGSSRATGGRRARPGPGDARRRSPPGPSASRPRAASGAAGRPARSAPSPRPSHTRRRGRRNRRRGRRGGRGRQPRRRRGRCGWRSRTHGALGVDPEVGVALGPEAAAGQEVAVGEPAGAVVARDDERQLHHPAVERHGAVVVAGVPQATELVDHAGRVVGHQATQVPDSQESAVTSPTCPT